MSASPRFDRLIVTEARPKVHIWIGPDGRIRTVLVSDYDDEAGLSIPGNAGVLVFSSNWEVTVTVVDR